MRLAISIALSFWLRKLIERPEAAQDRVDLRDVGAVHRLEQPLVGGLHLRRVAVHRGQRARLVAAHREREDVALGSALERVEHPEDVGREVGDRAIPAAGVVDGSQAAQQRLQSTRGRAVATLHRHAARRFSSSTEMARYGSLSVGPLLAASG